MRRPLLLTFVGLLASLFFLLPESFTDGPPKDSEFVYARIRYHMTPIRGDDARSGLASRLPLQ